MRRTATIKSDEFSELIVLRKNDLQECLRIHPDAAKSVYKIMRSKISSYKGANKRRLSKSLENPAELRTTQEEARKSGNDGGVDIKGLTVDEFINNLSARWDVPATELHDFGKQYQKLTTTRR